MSFNSNFNQQGIDIGHLSVNMNYLYGISDFFSVMFENTEMFNLLLEADAYQASDIYSKFLQMTSTISLSDIQSRVFSPIKLVLVSTNNAVTAEPNTFIIPDSVSSSRYIANRPFLPTVLLEKQSDFIFEIQSDGTTKVKFSKDISDIGFPSRLLSDQVTVEYALWLVDVELDEQWITKFYGSMIGVDPQISTDAYKNFVYGLYYIYTHGPSLELMRKGLNLCLGLPLARMSEQVIEIRYFMETDEYLVVTDQSQYLVPYGLKPSVQVGDSLVVGQELAQWVEIKDYKSNDEWWINLLIPFELIRELPSGQNDRYATRGSHYDYLMRNYLKTHTFLVNIKVTNFKNNQVFSQLSSIISRAKPSYTGPVYIWTVTREETLEVVEDMVYNIRHHYCEELNSPIYKFNRYNTVDPLIRDCPVFMRNTINYDIYKLTGQEPYVNGSPTYFNGTQSFGYANYIQQYRTNTDVEQAWLGTVFSRNSSDIRKPRFIVGFHRSSNPPPTYPDIYSPGDGVQWLYSKYNIDPEMRILPLYITTQKDIEDKCASVGVRVPALSEWIFDFYNISQASEAINSLTINEGLPDDATASLISNYSTLFFRGSNINYLDSCIPKNGYLTWAPSVGDIQTGDFLLGVRILNEILGMYWVTSNQTILFSYNVVEDSDQLLIKFPAKFSRGFGPGGSSAYATRGFALVDGGGTVLSNTFQDSENTTPVILTRAGAIINHRMDNK